jgi:hypothetical protein
MNIIFAFTAFYISIDLQFKYELFEKNSIKQTKSNSYSKRFYNCAKIEHVGLHSVQTNQKNWLKKRKIIKIYFAECQTKTLGKA